MSSSTKKRQSTQWLSKNNVDWLKEQKKAGIFNSESEGTDFCIKLARLLENKSPELVKALWCIV